MERVPHLFLKQLHNFSGSWISFAVLSRRGTKLPESLSQAAVEVARQHSVYAVAHALRLDYTRLKERLGGVPGRRRKSPKPAFVELVTPQPAAREESNRVRVGEPPRRLSPIEAESAERERRRSPR